MSNWLIVLVTVAYVGTTIDLFYKSQFGFAIMFLGYSVANIGILMAMSKWNLDHIVLRNEFVIGIIVLIVD